MADDLQANLENYSVQLQQVNAALAAEPDNEELLKLRDDLTEVINITQELLQPHASNSNVSSSAGSSTDKGTTSTADANEAEAKVVKDWKVGELCMAIWSKNGQYYEAVIDGISEGKAVVTFVGYNVTEINKLHQLRLHEEHPVKKYVWDSKNRPNRAQWQADKEKRRKKALKKAQRMKQMEEEKETDKNKWKDFSSKAVSKSLRGVKRESIFASPDTEKGRVGVGTCGVSGKPMTKHVTQEKHHVSASSKTHYSIF